MKWKRVAVGNHACLFRNEHGALITFSRDKGEVKFSYISEGKGFAEGKITFLTPSQIPDISEISTNKIKREGKKYIKITFFHGAVKYSVEEEVKKMM